MRKLLLVIALLLWLSPKAEAAIAHVQTTGAQTGGTQVTTLSATFAGSVTAGSLIVVSTCSWKPAVATQVVSTVADNKGNGNYTLAVATPRIDSETICYQYYMPNVATGGTTFQITVTWNSGCLSSMVISEYTGAATSPTVVTSSNSGSGGPGPTVTSGAASAGSTSLYVGFGGYNFAGTGVNIGTSAPFTERLIQDETNVRQATFVSDLLSSSGSQNATWSFNQGTGSWTAGLATYSEAAGGGGGGGSRPPSLLLGGVGSECVN